jgi:hypothetical protein
MDQPVFSLGLNCLTLALLRCSRKAGEAAPSAGVPPLRLRSCLVVKSL